MRSAGLYAADLGPENANINRQLHLSSRAKRFKEGACTYSPIWFSPLNTYNLHPSVGLRASGGSLYLSSVLVPSESLTVLVAAARRPERLKLGLALSSTGGAEDGEWERGRERGREVGVGRVGERERGRTPGDADRRVEGL